eukprot:CAMPEP_0116549230 /NCGR_PEP_ID=MMETSP0397-20121206/4761_1 /TAXON_ID=216820 /ORGANISM="Cyclophora tenuis, Strain ECT3854" /LENGTH=634 /DNA_ID=CAMNT_0004073937 /DNA_START=552 /DNA_END=2456 /DNA_ORIENTATION=-
MGADEEVEVSVDVEAGKGMGESDAHRVRKTNHSAAMASSVLRFKDVNFIVGKGDKEKYILQDVSGKVKHGHVLAIMGPSGAGKTTLISALTLDAFYGTPHGTVTLNGVPLNDHIFKRHCFVVKQQDKHWPYLTTRETLFYAAELYEVAEKKDIALVVDDIIEKMGLDSCKDTRCARLSGGQRRRLSIAVALLKQPTLLFLDEPTSGLDAAAASNIMNEIIRVAKEEHLIIVCTIHQPSTKVYNGFDEIMIMSKGREAFAGKVEEAVPYFEKIGFPLPPATNPAEHFLDLVNADFSSEEDVNRILNTWEEHKPGNHSTHHSGKDKKEEADDEDGDAEGVVDPTKTSITNEIAIMFRRHFVLIIRDPILYLGRCLIFLVSNLVFAFVYWNARSFTQDQAVNKLWINIWFVGVPTNMGVVAVYALNDEFKSVMRETKNGMVSAASYVLAKTILVIPIMFIFALFALGIPSFVIQDTPPEAFGVAILLWAALIYVFECAAEALAVAFDDPILGMLQFMNLWFASFLFGGFLIPLRDMYWPLKLFYYIMPYQYYIRSGIYNIFSHTTFDSCAQGSIGAVCIESTDGKEVLNELAKIFPLLTKDDQVVQDIIILVAIAVVYKVFSIVVIIFKSRKVANIR